MIMKKKSIGKSFTALLLALLLCLSCFGCNKDKPTDGPGKADPELTGCAIQHELEFGGVYIEIKIDDFNNLGFKYGDSVRVEFSNGFKLEDVPYYNGYYVDAGSPLLIAYPGYDYIKAAINYGADLWEEGALYAGKKEDLFLKAELDDHCTASVYLNEHGKYLDVQEARDIHYSDERSKFPSDVAFANFRNFHPGNIKEGVLYRSASPCDNQHKRAPYVDTLMKEAGVNCILNLSDNDAKIEKYMAKDDFNSPYFKTLYEAGNVIPIALAMNFVADEFHQKIAAGFTEMIEKDGPYLIHCTEGKDRTGFVCMLLAALGGASYQEIVDDYMITYDNYYEITEAKDKAKYDVILEKNLIAMMKVVAGDESIDLKTADLSACAKAYLRKAGMTDGNIEKLIEKICLISD